MKNILKQLEAWGTVLRQSEFERATLKLTLYYVASSFLILATSSFAIVFLFAPPEAAVETEHEEWSNYEFREHLVSVVVAVDISVLLLVSVFSYLFARRTLSPIKENQERKEQFMGTVAHELRTPLSVMRAGGETMLRHERTTHEYQEYINDVCEEAQRLTRLSNQLLGLLKSNTHTSQVAEMCDVSTICTRELRRFLPYAKTQHVQLIGHISDNVSAVIRRDDFIQLLQNLVKNGIDYNRPGGVVTVTLGGDAKEITLTITDTGIGISKDKLPTLFERFKTLNTTGTYKPGTGVGLGLAIVKEIVLQHNGKIEVDSQVDQGTTATVVFPK